MVKGEKRDQEGQRGGMRGECGGSPAASDAGFSPEKRAGTRHTECIGICVGEVLTF